MKKSVKSISDLQNMNTKPNKCLCSSMVLKLGEPISSSGLYVPINELPINTSYKYYELSDGSITVQTLDRIKVFSIQDSLFSIQCRQCQHRFYVYFVKNKAISIIPDNWSNTKQGNDQKVSSPANAVHQIPSALRTKISTLVSEFSPVTATIVSKDSDRCSPLDGAFHEDTNPEEYDGYEEKPECIVGSFVESPLMVQFDFI